MKNKKSNEKMKGLGIAKSSTSSVFARNAVTKQSLLELKMKNKHVGATLMVAQN